MSMTRKINVDLKKTVKNAVGKNEDFHFFVDELSKNDYMPTYAGMADEKYTFESMDDAFFEFLERKSHENGIYIRLIHATATRLTDGAAFNIEYGEKNKTVKVTDTSDVLVFDFADFGIKVLNDEVTFGTTVEGGCHHTPYFAGFGSGKGNDEYLSLENPFNLFVIQLIEEMIFKDE